MVFVLFFTSVSAPAQIAEADCVEGDSAATICEQSRIELSRSMVDEGHPPWTQQRAVEEPNADEWTLANFNIDYEFDWAA